METTYDTRLVGDHAAWAAVLSMALCVAVLIASEFMPVSLLSPIAADLGITEGRTGQAISISGAFAVVTSLLVASLTRRIDRKLVVTGFTMLLIVAGLAVTLAPNYAFLMVGRALLGIAIGGFWSMSTSIVMRLMSDDLVPKGLAMLNAGNAIAATIAAPLGSFLGAYVGWRGAFFLVVPLGLLALVWQWISLPPLPPRGGRVSGNVLLLLRRRPVALGMASVLMLFMGQFVYVGIFLVGMSLSYSPWLVMWAGIAAIVAWSIGFLWVALLPDTLMTTSRQSLDSGMSSEAVIGRFLDPRSVSLTNFFNQIVFLGLVTLILTATVWRSRQLVRRQVAAESERASLSRYFSPNIVRELSANASALDRPVVQEAAILFADMVGFTRLTERMEPEALIGFLREFHGRLARVAFSNGGTVDKYIGDAIMLHFGTPRPRDSGLKWNLIATLSMG
ncbi:MFS transporter [Mesorhizobium caraganae]|uniref:MFS transporter n=1 Tax=Mesorhizobium caraganae TaxID=483206 RepID=A0ABV1Z059_9HYPH